MRGLRHLLKHSPPVVALIVLLALAMRIVVPAGFMPSFGGAGASITLCTADGPMRMTSMRGGHHGDGRGDGHGDAARRCAFADLAVPALGGANPIQLADALLFILALGIAPAVARIARTAPRLRPPPRGPPLLSTIR